MALAQFYSSVGRSVTAGPPQPQDLQAFVAAAAEHGVSLGSAQDNAAIGIYMFTQVAPKMKRPANMTH
jgi:hypothetical protein